MDGADLDMDLEFLEPINSYVSSKKIEICVALIGMASQVKHGEEIPYTIGGLKLQGWQKGANTRKISQSDKKYRSTYEQKNNFCSLYSTLFSFHDCRMGREASVNKSRG